MAAAELTSYLLVRMLRMHDFAEALLDHIYVLRKRFEDLKNRWPLPQP
jgi:hypothetical protein